MPAIGMSPSEVICSKCSTELQTEALKCARCSCFMHLRCSDLPMYMLIRFKTSQSQYICRGCILTEGNPDSLKEAEESITQNMQLEKDIIEDAAHDSSIMHSPEGKVKDTEETGKKEENLNNNNIQQPKIDPPKNKSVCKYYLMRECKHGRLGNACRFSHPKIWAKFSKNGDRRGGL